VGENAQRRLEARGVMTMQRVVYTYEPVRVQAFKRHPCPVCGKLLRRQRTFQETINPFNKNPDGTQKTGQEVLRSVQAKADAWQQAPETCSNPHGS
jgi:hypothetical protein